MDGVDYWILETVLKLVQPRLIVLEYQELWGAHQAKTRPYSDEFDAHNDISQMGASLPAFEKLLKSRNYRLVGCHSGGYNAFFIKRGIGPLPPPRPPRHLSGLGAAGDLELPEYPIRGCFGHHKGKWLQTIAARQAAARKVPWVDVAAGGLVTSSRL
jgi:hypothetical protein